MRNYQWPSFLLGMSSKHFYIPSNRTKESAGDRDGLHPEHLAKRPCTVSPSQRFSPSSGLPAHPPPNGLPTHPPNGLPHPNPPAPQHYRLEDMALAHHYRDAYRHAEHRDVRDRHRQSGQIGVAHSKINRLVYSDSPQLSSVVSHNALNKS